MRATLALLAMIAASGSQALALDRAPAPAEARPLPCPEYGSGFGRIPGTSTCVRLSGRVTAGADLGAGPRAADPVSGRFAIDTRSETDLGTARAFVRVDSGRRLPR